MRPARKNSFNIEGCENELFCIYRRNCIRRGIEFRLSLAHLKKLTSLPCEYCACPPRNKIKRSRFTFLYQGIDRKDNGQGYVYENVVPCCPRCNSIKGNNLSHEEMLRVAIALKKLKVPQPETLATLIPEDSTHCTQKAKRPLASSD